MKNLIIILSMLFVNTFLYSQITLNKTVPTSNVDQIAVYGTAAEVHFSTATNYMTYNCGDLAPTIVGAEVNDIINNKAVGNDTLSINKASSDYYYGIDNGTNNIVTDGTNSHILAVTVNALGSDATFVYTIARFGTQFNIAKIQGASISYPGSNFSVDVNDDLDAYTDIDYFEFGGNPYLAIVAPFAGNSQLKIYDLTSAEYAVTDAFGVTSTTYSDGVLYYSVDNEIHELTNFTSVMTGMKTVTSTVAYTIDAGQTINEFAFGSWGGDINVAATDGIYSECSSTVSVNELKPMDGYSVFPNPNSGQFTIQGIENGATISILNSQGQLMFEQKETTESNLSLNLEFPDGMYFIKVQSNDVIQTERVIINN